MFTKYSFKAKLLTLCVLMTSVSLAVGLTSYFGLKSVEKSYDRVVDLAMPNLNTLNDMFLSYRSVRINLRTLGLPGLSQEQAELAVGNVKESILAYEKADKLYNDIPFQVGEQAIYDKVNASWSAFKSIGVKVLALHKMETPQAHEKLVKIFLEDCPQAAKDYTEAINKLKDFHNLRAREHVATAKSTVQNTHQLVILFSIIGMLVGLSVGYFFSNSISRTISNVAQSIASNADQVTSASNQIASSSEELSQAATQQAASLEETAASLDQITSMITKSSESIQLTAVSSMESQTQAEDGRVAVNKMLVSMEEISQSNQSILSQVTQSNRQMTEIVTVIREIGNKTKVINEIVFQTKLLSFNASVEAARAGEHGKGFAVVAEEVGNLAQMSGNAAKEISEMLETSISKVEIIVEETKSKVESLIQLGKVKVDNGVEVAKQCSNALNQIVQNVSKVSSLSREIAQANKEQALGVAEINKAMSQLDVSTQQNAATSEEAASAAEQLSAQAESLKSVADDLLVVIHGMNEGGTARQQNLNLHRSETVNTDKRREAKVVHLTSYKTSKSKSAVDSSSGAFSMKKVSGESGFVRRDDGGFHDV